MMDIRILRWATGFALLFFSALLAGPSSGAESALETVVFGSCAHQELDQRFWWTLLGQDPDLLLLLGDNIYADTRNPREMRSAYAKLSRVSGWRELRARIPVLSVWDDHDYGENDAGADYPMRRESEEMFLDFFAVPANSPRRLHPGIYGSEILGPPGRRVQILLLDTRTFRGPLKKAPKPMPYGRYVPQKDENVPMLGEGQWAWLERELRRPAEFRILVSSIQVIPEEHGWEKWGNLPHERTRLLELIRDTEAAGVVILSGDRHLAEISRLSEDSEGGVGYPLWEVTSSSLNRSLSREVTEPNRHRVGSNYSRENLGRLRFDWGREDPRLTVEILDMRGGVVMKRTFRRSELQPRPITEQP